MRNISLLCLLLFASFFSAIHISLGQDGANDITFNPSDHGFGNDKGPNGKVFAIETQNDGNILIGGIFSSYNDTTRNRIARLNKLGRLDTGFNPGQGANDTIKAIAVQNDGKILIGGDFTKFNGEIRNRIARLNTDGSLDNTFDPRAGTNGGITTIAIQSDGKILVGGNFTNFDGTTRGRIARLNVNGTVDKEFTSEVGANNFITDIALQADGKILIAGDFTSYNNIARSRIARLNSTGGIDDSFNPGLGADKVVKAIAIQSSGNVLIGGYFQSYDGNSYSGLVRLRSDGSLDTMLNPGESSISNVEALVEKNGEVFIRGSFTYQRVSVNTIGKVRSDGSIDFDYRSPRLPTDGTRTVMSIQDDGKILIAGESRSFDGAVINFVIRINNDGYFDPTFNSGTGANDGVFGVAIQSDEKIVIGGAFTTYNGVIRNHVARLNSDGTTDLNFNPGTGADAWIVTVVVQPDSRILVGGFFRTFNGTSRNSIARLNSDGSLDMTFDPGAGANYSVDQIVLQDDGKIVILGRFSSYNDTPRLRIARLNVDGSLDKSFDLGTGPENEVSAVAIQKDGKILLGGWVKSYSGVPHSHIIRLNVDGTLDAGFDSGTGAFRTIGKISLQSNGKIIVTGSFSTYSGIEKYGIVRLNTDGTIDDSFNPPPAIYSFGSLTVESNDKLVFVKSENPSTNGINKVSRLNSDGSLDPNFVIGAGTINNIASITQQKDGRLIIAGEFTSYNGIGRNRIARIHNSSPFMEVGIKYSEKKFSLYPNPARSTVNLISSFAGGYVEVFNITGEKVHMTYLPASTAEVNLEYLDPGVYVVKFHHSEGVSLGTIILE
ncbi:MAG TPA: T9SS type A sorting domain-containing protein [Cytophagaceae bacterium]|jgi:uncharacterized delta-60 repeat protein